MFKVTGLLTIDRKILRIDEYELAQNPTTGAPIVGLKNHPSLTRVLPFIRSKDLTVAPAWRLIATNCNRCGQTYRDCACIKFVDDDVSDTVVDANLLGFFWTDRSAHQTAWSISESAVR
jgi:hypothetical protein